MVATINACFAEIDKLQRYVYDIIDSVASAEYCADSEESPEVARSALVKDANDHIRQIPDFLSVVEVALRSFIQESGTQTFLREKYELYSVVEASLRESLNKAQLEAYQKEHEAIHKQRLLKYKCRTDDAAEAADASLSTDLFAGRTVKSESKEEAIEAQITTHNKNITSTLKQTHKLMTMSVMQTELNIDSLDQQYKDLSTFNSKMVDMDSILMKSRQVVKFIERQDKEDKRRIYMAVGFLLLCSAWVIWRRVLRGPLRLLMWTLFKTLGFVNWIASKRETVAVEQINYGQPPVSKNMWNTHTLSENDILLMVTANSNDPVYMEFRQDSSGVECEDGEELWYIQPSLDYTATTASDTEARAAGIRNGAATGSDSLDGAVPQKSGQFSKEHADEDSDLEVKDDGDFENESDSKSENLKSIPELTVEPVEESPIERIQVGKKQSRGGSDRDVNLVTAGRAHVHDEL
ncbi:Sec20-domain-containing protein [Metschnikowia bicuspidata]|uniref:Sec20-domain-containing protein n=1 Tax=Metschnikowia bicuspidata TaxID=27322 RepID=A0A4P9ZGB3_9ASCO|nr:Sec20-domain-containing protein [Metschnikowia bicuspidata]